MPSMMAIISKSVFEQMTKGTTPTVGSVVRTDRYNSNSPRLDALKKGGDMYLVTVRPPNEALWLVAILEKPAAKAGAWIASANTIAIADITSLKSKLKFDTGVGIQAKPGALGMSLQTPRILTAGDEALLREAAGIGTSGAKPAAAATGAKKASAKAKSVVVAEKPPRDLVAQWQRMSPSRQARMIHLVEARSKGTLRFARTHTFADVATPVFVHAPTGATFHLVLGGTSELGMRSDDLKEIRAQLSSRSDARRAEAILAAQKPAKKFEQPTFVMAERPLTATQLMTLLMRKPNTLDTGRSLRKATTAEYIVRPTEESGSISEHMITGLQEALTHSGMRLPTEREWEFAARAGTGALCNGNTVNDVLHGHRNRFGLADMGWQPELCIDANARSVRGGAARTREGDHTPAWTQLICAVRNELHRYSDALAIRPVLAF